MWIFSSKRLLHIYGEKKLYITDILYDRNRLPHKIYLFLNEYGTEIELAIKDIKLVKRNRSVDSEIYKASLQDKTTVLFKLDFRRGNHYLYCRQTTYQNLIRLLSTRDMPTPSSISHQEMQIKNKILLIDTELIPELIENIDSLVQSNEIIFSPYYSEWLNSHELEPSQLSLLQAKIDRISRRYSGKLITNQYVDLNSNRYPLSNLSDDKDYLVSIALQMNVTLSQILIVTRDAEWSQFAHTQGIKSVSPIQLSASNDKRLEENPPLKESAATSVGLPPRSQRRGRRPSFLSFLHFWLM